MAESKSFMSKAGMAGAVAAEAENQKEQHAAGNGTAAVPEDEESKMDRMRNHIIQALMRSKGINAANVGGNPAGPANAWHSRRRAKLLGIPGVKALLGNCSYSKTKELFISMATIVAALALHVFLARALSRFATGASASTTALSVFLASASVGGQLAFVLQGLNHELGHGSPMVELQGPGRQAVFLTCFTLGSFGAALCHIPWTAYYMGGGHVRHHRFVGTARDVDEDALFLLYRPFCAGVVKRVAWLSLGTVLVPALMFYSLCRCTIYDWRSNIKELSLVTLDFTLTGFAYYNVGGAGMAYLYLSSLFSMGFLAHPLIGFWIVQHLCVGGAQPTVSYSGSRIWNILCLNELLHVEHHDFACIPWRHLPKLRELAPEFYEPLHSETSIMALIGAWARAGGPDGDKRFSWDFACRTEWGYTRRDAQAMADAASAAAAMMKTMGAAGRTQTSLAPSSASSRQRRPGTESKGVEPYGMPRAASPTQLRKDLPQDPSLID